MPIIILLLIGFGSLAVGIIALCAAPFIRAVDQNKK